MVVGLWRELLKSKNQKASASLADPKEYPNLFPGHLEALKTEQFLQAQRLSQLPASSYSMTPVSAVFFPYVW